MYVAVNLANQSYLTNAWNVLTLVIQSNNWDAKSNQPLIDIIACQIMQLDLIILEKMTKKVR